jgi:hypothetical protein
MGILTALKLGRTQRPDYLASPWSETQLQSLVLSDIFGDAELSALPLTRAEAMRVPAVAKARNLLVASIAKLPLRALDARGEVPTQPTWMYRSDEVSPWHRLAWTVDDLVFFGAAIWWVERGADGFPVSADRVAPERWKITDGHILIDEEEADEKNVVYIPGPAEGLLEMASRTIRGSRAMEEAWVARVETPIPLAELRATNQQVNHSNAEIKAFLDDWGKAIRSKKGGVGYTPYGYELVDHGATEAALFEQGRNAVRTDIGGFLGIPSAFMDSSVQGNSADYRNGDMQRSTFMDFTLPLWLDPISQRLSMDDVMPRGQRARFDLSDLLSAPIATGTPVED